MTSSTSLPSLSSMLKSPALKHSSATRGRLSYFGPGQSSSIRRTRPVVPIVASPSLPRPTPPITKPQEHEISTKKRRVQDSAQPFAFAQPSYIATPERKSTQKSSSMQGASASRIPTFSKPSSNGATPSPLKAALGELSSHRLLCNSAELSLAASKQSAAEKAAETSKAAPSPQKSTRAADLMRNIIQEEQASHPVCCLSQYISLC